MKLWILLIILWASYAMAQIKATVTPMLPGQHAVALTWVETGCSACTFKVYRGATAGGENYATPIGTTAAGVLAYTDSAVVSGTTYYYTVTAYSTSESLPSNEANAVIPISPNAPSGLSATAN